MKISIILGRKIECSYKEANLFYSRYVSKNKYIFKAGIDVYFTSV